MYVGESEEWTDRRHKGKNPTEGQPGLKAYKSKVRGRTTSDRVAAKA